MGRRDGAVPSVPQRSRLPQPNYCGKPPSPGQEHVRSDGQTSSHPPRPSASAQRTPGQRFMRCVLGLAGGAHLAWALPPEATPEGSCRTGKNSPKAKAPPSSSGLSPDDWNV
mmetsp:Transcript_57721/g.94801  ORF Transcript_57721/g.94801 Transcript_57721/m.94801 type:complete len:112 (+) Transcript_57721:150-485(+)